MIEIRIKCNDCGEIGAAASVPYVPAHILRRRLKKQGWTVELQGGKDRCPACIKILKLEKEFS